MDLDTDPNNPNKLTEHDELEDLFQKSPSQEDVDQGIQDAQDYANRAKTDRMGAQELKDLHDNQNVKDLYDPNDAMAGQANLSLLDRVRKRRKSIIGGSVATVLVGGGFGLFSFLQAPFQFIHLAQILNQQFEAVTDFSDNQGWKLIQYARTRGNPSKRNLGYLGNKFAEKYTTAFEKAGIHLDYTTPSGRQSRAVQNFVIDGTTDEGKDFLQRARSKGIDPGDFIDIGEGKFRISVRGSGGAPRTRRLISVANDSINLDKVAAWVSRRVNIPRAGANWHRLGDRARRAGESIKDWWSDLRKEDAEKIQSGADLDKRSTSGTKEDVDGDGEPDTDTSSLSKESNELIEEIEKAETPDARKGIAGKLTKGGVALALAGAMCTVHDLSKGYEEYQHQNVDLVLERMGFAWSSTGSQVMSGIGVNVNEAGAYNEQLYDKTAPVGERSVFSARPMQALTGQALTGPDISKAARPTNPGVKPVIFRFADSIPGIDQGCGVRDIGKKVPILGRILNTIDAASDYVINTGLKAFGLSAEDLINGLYYLLRHGGVNVIAKGAELGTLLPHGIRLAAIDDFIAKGGRMLTGTEEAALDRHYAQLRHEEFATKSFWTRLFDPYEPESLVAKAVLESPSIGDPVSSYAALTRAPFSILPGIGSNLAKITQPSAYAQSQRYRWGYNLFGYSLGELDRIAKDAEKHDKAGDDDSMDNPYAVARVLEADNGKKLDEGNKKWGKCLGAAIDPATGVFKAGKTVNRNKLPKVCHDSSDEYLQYRLYYASRQVELAYACYEDDEPSCNAIGFGVQQVGGPATPVGNGACDSRTKSLGPADGYTGGTLQKIQICALPNLTSDGEESNSSSSYYITGSEGKAIVNSDVSKSVFDMVEAAKKDGVTLSAGSAFRTQTHQQALCDQDNLCRNGTYSNVAKPGTSNHQMGLAIDFDISKCPTRIGGKCAAPGEPEWDWLNVNASKFGFSQYSEEAWHWSTTGN